MNAALLHDAVVESYVKSNLCRVLPAGLLQKVCVGGGTSTLKKKLTQVYVCLQWCERSDFVLDKQTVTWRYFHTGTAAFG